MAISDDALRAETEFYALTLERLGRALPGARVTFLLDFLERHPLGAHNRAAAEHLEQALDSLPDTPLRAHLAGRFHGLREPLLPPLVRRDPREPG